MRKYNVSTRANSVTVDPVNRAIDVIIVRMAVLTLIVSVGLKELRLYQPTTHIGWLLRPLAVALVRLAYWCSMKLTRLLMN